MAHPDPLTPHNITYGNSNRDKTVQPKNEPTGPVSLKIWTSPIRFGTTRRCNALVTVSIQDKGPFTHRTATYVAIRQVQHRWQRCCVNSHFRAVCRLSRVQQRRGGGDGSGKWVITRRLARSKGAANMDTWPSMLAKCIGVCLILWLHQTTATVYDVRVKRAQFTTHVQVSALADSFDRRRRVMAGVHVL